VKKPVVADSTCLIGLERIGKLNLVPALFDPVMIPPEIDHEFGTMLSWLNIEPVISSALVAALRLAVDAGEAEAIALASEKNCLLISDDKKARTVAKRLGLTVLVFAHKWKNQASHSPPLTRGERGGCQI
jgi:uncharacterized protein